MWTRDEIADIADDSVDASGPAYDTEALNSRIMALEARVQSLESEGDYNRRAVEARGNQIDLLNEHADKDDERFESLVEHYNKHTH